jgi:hypothetical protein
MSRRSSLWIGLALALAAATGTIVALNRAPESSNSTTTIPRASHLQPDSSIWPFASTATRYADPVAATKGFATAYLGFTDPIVGTFHASTGATGEVSVKATSDAVATTVLLRQLTSARSWWIVGVRSPQIVVTAPSISQSISSPVTLKGRSTAYEAVVNVQVRQAGSLKALADDVVMGGSLGTMGPFLKAITFATPSASKGAILFRTISPKDGHVIEASVVPVTFAH